MNTFLILIALAAPAAAPNAGLPPAAAAPAAAAAVAILPAVVEVPAAAAVSNVLPIAAPSDAASVRRLRVYPPAVETPECSPDDILRKRFLSAPWSASRRLEAAQRRGDAEEARRMEAMQEAYTLEALEPSDE